jgi:hypothetical protein
MCACSATVLSSRLFISPALPLSRSMKGPPRIAGFFTAAAWTSGDMR